VRILEISQRPHRRMSDFGCHSSRKWHDIACDFVYQQANNDENDDDRQRTKSRLCVSLNDGGFVDAESETAKDSFIP
jgi:hypothetical protein